MNYLISYDIQEDNLRLKVSKFLLKRGCERIQKSVFVSMEMSNKEFKTFEQKLGDLVKNKFQSSDSIWVVSIPRQQLEESLCLGSRTALDSFLEEEFFYFV